MNPGLLTQYTLDYQLSDSLSLMASSANGRLQVALLNELGSVRIFRTAGTALKVVHQDDPLPVEPDLGTGRMVGAVGTCRSQDSVFVYERQTNQLRHYYQGSSGRIFGQTLASGNERLVEVSRSNSGASYSTTNSDTLFTYDTIKSGAAMREGDTSWEGVFSEAYLGNVYWWTNIW